MTFLDLLADYSQNLGRRSVEREFVSNVLNWKLLCFRRECRDQIYLVNKYHVIKFSICCHINSKKINTLWKQICLKKHTIILFKLQSKYQIFLSLRFPIQNLNIANDIVHLRIYICFVSFKWKHFKFTLQMLDAIDKPDVAYIHYHLLLTQETQFKLV